MSIRTDEVRKASTRTIVQNRWAVRAEVSLRFIPAKKSTFKDKFLSVKQQNSPNKSIQGHEAAEHSKLQLIQKVLLSENQQTIAVFQRNPVRSILQLVIKRSCRKTRCCDPPTQEFSVLRIPLVATC
jgi:hypothetical protein